MSDESLVIPVKQTEDLEFVLTYKDENGTEIDLTGFSVEATLKRSVSDSSYFATVTATIRNQITNTGEILITLPAASSTKLVTEPATDYRRPYKLYPCDVFLISPASKRECLASFYYKAIGTTK